MPWTLHEIATRAHARGAAPAGHARRVVTDSRGVEQGDLFVALHGDRFDGHRFLGEAHAAGAVAALVDHEVDDAPPRERFPQIVVEDTLRALADLARAERAAFEGPVVAITGSNGKTTTKELCADLLEATGQRVVRSPGSLNNHIGLPLSILGLDPDCDALVVELGMNHPGELDALAEIARPTIGAITCVAPAHLGPMGSIEAIALAKGELLDHLGPGTTAVLNADDAHVMAQAPRAGGEVLRFGIEADAEVRAKVDGRRVAIETPIGARRVTLVLPGRHLVYDALCATACAIATGRVGPDDLASLGRALARFRGLPGRLSLRDAPGGLRLLDDSYNANPRSMAAALETLTALRGKGRVFAVLGDMLELGDQAEALHAELGRDVADAGLDGLCGLGELSEHTVEGARQAGLQNTRLVSEPTAAALWIKKVARRGDIVLLKGSRGARVERVAVALLEDA